ncbi:MAG: bifunctional diguanylate cyclase/phosphodiesterase [Spirochaetales bacterium]|uniref:Bifunctional diguanylate cyclase/phosphodiesterase n=1 Tax=Candidatus Thalassospirochaeta sargassi TaxID=3119039 RepID=A0AAJ1MK57_9SPIO|nr:bifunctional diguanylate cyclase/phosphodiesterase [Spirochaetales bacterium]
MSVDNEEAAEIINNLRNERDTLLEKIRSLMIRLEHAERRQQNSSLMMLYDEVTGLPNHHKMDRDIGSMLWDFFKLPKPPKISVLLIKLDENFNHVRQAFNPDVFNNILSTLAERLKLMLDTRGLLYHPRLDEFAVFIFDSISDHDLAGLAYDIRDNISGTIDNQVYRVKVGCNIGIASFPEDGLNKRMLLSSADIALSYAVGRGADVVFFSEDMRQKVIGNLEMQNDLLSAIEVKTLFELSENFTLYFQPIITVDNIVEDGINCEDFKAEVLIRWKDPNRGSVLPRNLIEVAEETGLILPIGRWLLKASMMKLSEWRREYFNLKLSINISPRQFFNRGFTEELRVILNETGVRADDIYLEITESCLFNDQDYASEEIKKLSDMGFKITLDDFGTGYSSLGYLNKFKTDTVKIDKIFIEGLSEEGKKRELIKSIVKIGHELDLDVVFEGIEELEQLKEAYSLGCRTFQGYFFSRPLPVEEFEQFMNGCKENYIAFPD